MEKQLNDSEKEIKRIENEIASRKRQRKSMINKRYAAELKAEHAIANAKNETIRIELLEKKLRTLLEEQEPERSIRSNARYFLDERQYDYFSLFYEENQPEIGEKVVLLFEDESAVRRVTQACPVRRSDAAERDGMRFYVIETEGVGDE